MNILKTIRRLLPGAVKNAVVWGAAWSALAFATVIGLRTIGVVVPPEINVLDVIGMAVRIGIVGGMAGGAFAAFISLFYHGRRLSEISWVRFGLGGAVVAEAFIIALFTVGNLATGDAIPELRYIFSDLVMAAVFGGISAGGSMWLAQRAGPRPIGRPDAHGRLYDGAAALGAEDFTHHPRVRARP